MWHHGMVRISAASQCFHSSLPDLSISLVSISVCHVVVSLGSAALWWRSWRPRPPLVSHLKAPAHPIIPQPVSEALLHTALWRHAPIILLEMPWRSVWKMNMSSTSEDLSHFLILFSSFPPSFSCPISLMPSLSSLLALCFLNTLDALLSFHFISVNTFVTMFMRYNF